MRIKIIFQLTFCFIVSLSNSLFPQDFIKQFDGIPLITYTPHDIGAYHYDNIKAMGIDAVIVSNLTTERLLEISKRSLKVFPVQSDTTVYDPNYSDIIKYTDARYSVWEAEGTETQNGDATLTYNNAIAELFYAGNKSAGIVTKKNSVAGILITGPGYKQEIFYRGINVGKIIQYNARVKLKLEFVNKKKKPNPADTVCVFQITNSSIKWSRIVDEILVKERPITIRELMGSKWKEISVDYDFQVLNPVKSGTEFFPSSTWASFVNFNIIWKGNPLVRLYVDKIIISDERGREIANPKNHERIVNQDMKSFSVNIDDKVAGWFAVDEPESIDNYEPIRLVDSILNKVSSGKRRLWISFPSSWNGKYGDSPLGAELLFKWREFTKRTKIIGKQNNHTIFDYPLTASENPFGGDYRKKNIDIFIDSVLSVIHTDDTLFALCLQGGRYDRARLFKDPSPKEILYTANLGLMYGAKALTIYRYFGEDNNLKHSGLVNYTTKDGYIFTEKYKFFKNVVSPRLKGEFGRTIKQLRQTQQIAGIDLISNKNVNLNFIKTIEPVNAKSNDTCIVEIGFFQDWKNAQALYFMAVNRYYSSVPEFKFTIQNLEPNAYYEIKNFIENTVQKVYTDKNGLLIFKDTISPGDASLYRIQPI